MRIAMDNIEQHEDVPEEAPSLSQRVIALFRDSLFQGDPDPDKAKMVEGITFTAGFDPERLAANKDKIIAVAREIVDDAFLSKKGGGMSFMALPFARTGEQWGEQEDAQLLYLLCAGIGYASCVVPRLMWGAFPGGVPYIVFKNFDEEGAPTDGAGLHDGQER